MLVLGDWDVTFDYARGSMWSIIEVSSCDRLHLPPYHARDPEVRLRQKYRPGAWVLKLDTQPPELDQATVDQSIPIQRSIWAMASAK
jgi:hypothetical protein